MSDNTNGQNRSDQLLDTDILLESLPPDVQASMEVRDRWFASSEGTSTLGLEFVLEDLHKWLPGQTLRVAFLGGNTTLHREIAEATQQITDACNITFDFGYDPVTDTYRTWSTGDTAYSADIRVSFDMDGNFSLIGTDAINPLIGHPGKPVGGRPNQRTLNLEGYPLHKPANWKGTVRHEFLHALAFQHEHQSPLSVCEQEFRWEDDSGYQPTVDVKGRYVTDSQDNRPGIYTYLAGYPNFWDKAKVDHNLRQLSSSNLTVSSFDRESIMLYRFNEIFYRRNPNPCQPIGDGQNLSDRDIAGLLKLYPFINTEIESTSRQRHMAFEAMTLIIPDFQIHSLGDE